MKSICIKTNNSNLLNYLLNELKSLDVNNVYFSHNKFKSYKNVIIHYKGDDLNLFLEKISSILSFLVIDELEEDILKSLISQNYFYFNYSEKNTILQTCFDLITDNFSSFFEEKFKILYDNFFNYLSSNKSIVLVGFVNFRLKNYIEILDNIVNQAVNSFIIEKEYCEFISLLKLYINSQGNNCNIVHLIYSKKESLLLDEHKNIINISDDIFNAKYLSDITFSSNDFALNSLLNLLPKKIYIHLTDNYIDEFINTLTLIFEKRIVLCTDCNICQLYKHSPLHFNVKNKE